MADENADASNKEQLIVCIRCVDDKFKAHEEFIGRNHLKDCNYVAIVDGMKSAITEIVIDTKKLRRLCYDGCSTMAGTKKGVTTLMKVAEKSALEMHLLQACYKSSLLRQHQASEMRQRCAWHSGRNNETNPKITQTE